MFVICNKCKTDAVINTAAGKQFWYCRTCKDEVIPEGIKNKTVVNDEYYYRVKTWAYDKMKDSKPTDHPIVPGQAIDTLLDANKQEPDELVIFFEITNTANLANMYMAGWHYIGEL